MDLCPLRIIRIFLPEQTPPAERSALYFLFLSFFLNGLCGHLSGRLSYFCFLLGELRSYLSDLSELPLEQCLLQLRAGEPFSFSLPGYFF